jgi:hypothetical protein
MSALAVPLKVSVWLVPFMTLASATPLAKSIPSAINPNSRSSVRFLIPYPLLVVGRRKEGTNLRPCNHA